MTDVLRDVFHAFAGGQTRETWLGSMLTKVGSVSFLGCDNEILALFHYLCERFESPLRTDSLSQVGA